MQLGKLNREVLEVNLFSLLTEYILLNKLILIKMYPSANILRLMLKQCAGVRNSYECKRNISSVSIINTILTMVN